MAQTILDTVTFFTMAAYNEEAWKGLMLQSLNGDASAYRALLEALQKWLNAYFKRRLPYGDYDDLIQMTLLSLHEKRHTYDTTAPFMPWLVAVAHHKLIDWVRKHKRVVQVELDETLTAPELADQGTIKRDVLSLLRYLSPDQQAAIRLHKLEELSIEDVSLKTGKSISSVKVLIHRGLKRLQTLVGQGQ